MTSSAKTTEPQSLTPTTHGAWRVIDGVLVDESTLPPADAAESAAETDPSPRRKAPEKTP